MTLVAAPVGSPSPTRTEPKSRGPNGRRLALSSYVYLPACSIAALAAVLIGLGWSRQFGGAGFAAYMSNVRVIAIGPISLAIIGVFLVAERVRPAQRRPLIARGHRQDVLFAILGATLVIPLVTALTLSFSEMARRTLPWIVLPKTGGGTALGCHGADLCGDGRRVIGSPISPIIASACCGASTKSTIRKRT